MRWVLIAAGALIAIVALAVLALLALSLRPGAGRIAGATEIARSPAEVWPWIVEGDRLKEWVGWLTEVEDLTPGVEGVGARRRWILIDPTMNDQRVVIEGEVTVHEPGRVSTMALESPGMFTGLGTYELVDLGGGRTRVDYASEFRMSAWIARLLEPVVTSQARRKAADDLARLKARIEAEEPATGTSS